MEFKFTLVYQLSNDDASLDEVVERLGEAGCDDALVGIGRPGRFAIEFTREAEDLGAAVARAQHDVKRAIPTATLIETTAQLAVAAFHNAKERARNTAGTVVREELARAFEVALSMVFEEAQPQHGLDARYVRYRQMLHGVYIAEFSDGTEVYDAAFDPDLRLECVTRVRDGEQIWMRLVPGVST
jgi:hypothetical protein